MQLMIARHAETTWNVERRIQGWTDSALTVRGSQQARALADRLRTTRISAIYCSDLGRAKMTAECVGLWHDLEVVTMMELRESSWGEWEGLTAEQIEERYPEIWPKFVARGQDSSEDHADWESNTLIPGGESMKDASDRIARGLSEIRARHENSADLVLVVGHGGSLRYMITNSLGVRPSLARRFHLDNGSLSEIWFKRDHVPVMHLLNDISHIVAMAATP
jgi:broad specificity phosphatase PhoE